MASDEPRVAGQPVTSAMYAVCFVHLLLCVLTMGYLIVGTPLSVEGVIVSPWLQWIYGTFTLISIVAIICAGIGTLYHIESHVETYSWVLLVSALIDLYFFVAFLFYGRACVTKHNDTHHLVATLSCGLQDGLSLICLTLLVIMKFFSLFIANKCKAYIRRVYDDNLIPFVQKHLAAIDGPQEVPWAGPPLPSMHNMMKSVPPSFANFLPSMRSEGNLTRFDSAPFPAGPMMPSIGGPPTIMPPAGYGAHGSGSIRHLGSMG
jgi:hypothetical protein